MNCLVLRTKTYYTRHVIFKSILLFFYASEGSFFRYLYRQVPCGSRKKLPRTSLNRIIIFAGLSGPSSASLLSVGN
jgi:hypothetical protein